ncbi:MAG: hypothetical protein IMZ69_04075 [Spirochaetes bacterium]|nr:hypothetical protein [Spirochaetota bacterium]
MNSRERAYVRSLAEQVRDIAREPIFAEKRELWRRKNRLIRTRPLGIGKS